MMSMGFRRGGRSSAERVGSAIVAWTMSVTVAVAVAVAVAVMAFMRVSLASWALAMVLCALGSIIVKVALGTRGLFTSS